jgi:hypothetical protein
LSVISSTVTVSLLRSDGLHWTYKYWLGGMLSGFGPKTSSARPLVMKEATTTHSQKKNIRATIVVN